MAEAHPVGFQWVMEAKARGAKVIHVDPRFTRTSAVADTLRADPGRHRHRVPRRRDQLHPEQRAGLPRVRAWRTPTRRRSSARTSATPRTSTGCSPASTRETGTLRPDAAGSTRAARQRRPAARQHRHGSGRRRERGLQHESHGAQVARADPRATRRCSTRAASTRSSSGTSPATPRRWSSRSAASRASSSCEVCRGLDGELGPGADHRAGLRGRLDPAQRRRAVHPHRRDPPAAAGQHGPARRRDHGAARARQHPGLDRHPDAVQPAARLPADAARADQHDASTTGWTRSATRTRRASGATPRPTRVSLLKAYWGDAATRGQRLLLRLPAPADRRPRHLPHGAGHDRRQGQGLLPARAEPGGRLGARPGAAARHGQPRLAGRPRPLR